MSPRIGQKQSIRNIRRFASDGALPDQRKQCWERYQQLQRSLEIIDGVRGDDVFVSDDAVINGQVWIDDGAQIFPGACVEGPTYIGRNAVVGTHSLVRGGTLLGDGSIIGNHCSSTRSVIGPKTGVYHHSEILNSIIGLSCHLSGFVITAASKADLSPAVPDPELDGIDEVPKRGIAVHERTFISPFVVTMPNTVIGKNCFIEPLVTVHEDLSEKTWFRNSSGMTRSENEIEDIKIREPPKYPFRDR